MLKIVYFCGYCNKPMELVQGKYGLFYRCPNHLYPSEEKGRKSCPCRLTLAAAEIIEKTTCQLKGAGKLDGLCSSGQVINMKKNTFYLQKCNEELYIAKIRRREGEKK